MEAKTGNYASHLGMSIIYTNRPLIVEKRVKLNWWVGEAKRVKHDVEFTNALLNR